MALWLVLAALWLVFSKCDGIVVSVLERSAFVSDCVVSVSVLFL